MIRFLFILALITNRVEASFFDVSLVGVAQKAKLPKLIMAQSPLAYWPLWDVSGTKIDNFTGVSTLDGTYSSVTLLATNIFSYPCPLWNGSSSYGNIYTTDLKNGFSGATGTLIVGGYVHPPSWIDGNNARIAIIRVDSNNRSTIFKSSELNTIAYIYSAGGTLKSHLYRVPYAQRTYPFIAAMTWNKSADRNICYFDGIPAVTNTGLGTFSGTLADAWIGSDSVTPTLPYHGFASHVACMTNELSASQIAGLFTFIPPFIQAGVTIPVSKVRSLMITEIWSGNGFPTATSDGVATGVTDPLAAYGFTPSNLLRVDQLTNILANNSGTKRETNIVYVWRPTAITSNNKLVVYHCGHTTTDDAFNVSGQGEMVQALVEAGYTVIQGKMPFGGVDAAATVSNHNACPAVSNTENYLRYFVESPIRSINQLITEGFSGVYMCGISGGGWTTALIAAMDTRIKASAHVAGSFPLTIPEANRDWEQFIYGLSNLSHLSSMLGIDFQDLYVMGTDASRTQLQILNLNDTCCFTGTTYNALSDPYGPHVQYIASRFGGTWTITIDSNNAHSISAASRTAIVNLFNAN